MFNNLNVLFEKTGEVDYKDYNPFLINKFLSMKLEYLKLLSDIDRYTFWINKEHHFMLLSELLPKRKTPFLNFIKKNKVDNEFDFILIKIKEHYGLSTKQMNELSLFFENDIRCNTKEYFKFYGVDKKYYKKFKIELNNEIIKKETKKNEWW